MREHYSQLSKKPFWLFRQAADFFDFIEKVPDCTRKWGLTAPFPLFPVAYFAWHPFSTVSSLLILVAKVYLFKSNNCWQPRLDANSLSLLKPTRPERFPRIGQLFNCSMEFILTKIDSESLYYSTFNTKRRIFVASH